MRYYVAVFIIVAVFILPWFGVNFPDTATAIVSALKDAGEQLAAVLLVHNPVTVEGLKSDYAARVYPGNRKIRVLVVPGHEPDFGGTEYGSLLEHDINVDMADALVGFLSQNPHFDAFTTRGKTAWSPAFDNYFKTNWDQIIELTKANRDAVKELIKLGEYTPVVKIVDHNFVSNAVGVRLHGINKWVNENDIDIVIHVHFNDYPHYNTSSPGKYNGFSIYVPERQYLNSTTTKAIANSVYERLAKYNPVSNLQGEHTGIIEDQELIAIGSDNSVNAASMLIEYAYIYEPQLNDPKVRPVYLREIAYETYIGILDFLDPPEAAAESKTFDTLVLPYTWEKTLTGKNDSPQDVFALQTALIIDGEYPPPGSNLNDCPRTGKLGPCTKSALQAFQQKYDITGEKGIAGPKTIKALNRIY